MRLFWQRKKTSLVIVLGLVLVSAGSIWMMRDSILSWYYLRGLAKAEHGEQAVWVSRLIGLNSAAVPSLIKGLEEDDLSSCTRFGEALDGLARHWGFDNPQAHDLAVRMANGFSHFSVHGQITVLKLVGRWQQEAKSQPAFSEVLNRVTDRILADAAKGELADVHVAALEACEALLAVKQSSNEVMNELVSIGLTDNDVNNRLKALRLACDPRVNLFKQVIPLLEDPEAEVRREVMQLMAKKPELSHLLSDDDLLRWLNDPDAEVRRVCEASLAQRGLKPEAVQLGRLITNEKPAVRLEVLKRLYPGSDLDANTWVRHLTHDPAPAVRSAAMRAAVQLNLRNLADRLDQMARMDPSPTVRQLAQHYLTMQQNRRN
jgi:hypothetical protein